MSRLALALLFALLPALALAQNYSASAGSGLTFGAKNITSVLYPQFLACDPTTPTQCAAISASGVVSVGGAVTNAGTFAVQDATLATDIGAPGATACTTDTASCSTNQQMQRLAQRLSTMVTALGTPFQAGGSIGNTTFTATQATGSNLHVVCDSGCSGSGGTSSTFGSAFPATGTAIGLTSGTNMVAWSATTNYGTAPAAIAVPAVNAFITNTNANLATNADAIAAVAAGSAGAGSPVNSANYVYNGTTWDRQRSGSQTGSVLVSPASQYPSGATPLTASATGTTAATTATLAGAVGKTTFVCGYSIRANASAAATGNATVTGTITGTLNFTQWTAPNASGIGINEQIFTPCVPASTTNTGIAVVSAAPGTGGVVSSTAWGYQL